MADAIFNAGWDNTLPLIYTLDGDAETPIQVSAALTTVTMTAFNGTVVTVNGTRCFIRDSVKLAVTISPVVGADTLFAAPPSGGFTTEEEEEE